MPKLRAQTCKIEKWGVCAGITIIVGNKRTLGKTVGCISED